LIKLSKGENITINTSKVIKNIKDLTIQNKEMKVNITPLIKKREIIYNNGIIITKPLKIIKNKIIFQNLSLISYKNLNIIKYNPLNYINFYLYLISMLNIMDRNFMGDHLILNIKYNSYKDIYDDLNNIIIKIFNLYPTR